MDHFRGVDLRILEHTAGDHVRRAVAGLFARLEHQFHPAFEKVFIFLQDLCGAEQHGRMHVMPAGMHLSGILRAETLFRNFGQRESVHVRTEEEDLSFLFSEQDRDAGLAAFLRLTAEFHQFVPYVFLRPGILH